jgi:cytochrome c-type protein NapC
MTRTRVLMLVMIGIGVGVAFAGSEFMHRTSTNEFCVSCHSMTTVNEEYQASVHYRNVSGVRAGCADCHVPKDTAPLIKAKLFAAKDVYHELVGTIDTLDKFEQRRWHLANVVWDKMTANDSRECRSCHASTSMDFDAQGRRLAKKHKTAEREGKTCIACHKGVAHTEPLPPSAAE